MPTSLAACVATAAGERPPLYPMEAFAFRVPMGKIQEDLWEKGEVLAWVLGRASRAYGSGGSCGIAVAFRCAANNRAVAWAVLGWCHLGAANALVRKFVAVYSQPVAPELGLRGPSIVEAEAADLEVCRQLGESLDEGLALDQALHECVKGPTLCTLLQLRPKMSKGHEVKESERVRPPKRARKKTCHKFQIGRCKNEKCQYAHVCEHCEGEHGWAKCPELKQP